MAEIAEVSDAVASDADDYVARTNARLLCHAAWLNLRDNRALFVALESKRKIAAESGQVG
jgi:hypothetical protein